jgi:hypothetical protein
MEKILLFLSKEYLDGTSFFCSIFQSQYNPNFFVAEHYVFRNTGDWWSKDVASVVWKHFCLGPYFLAKK